jgi:dGTP triphosphohydrolase
MSDYADLRAEQARREWLAEKAERDAPERTPLAERMAVALEHEATYGVATLKQALDRIARYEYRSEPDAPEQTPRWIGVPEEKYEELKAKVTALEQERDELDAHLMETLDQLDDCRLGLIDCLKSRSFELRQTEAEVERLRATIREKDEALEVAASVLVSVGRPEASRMCRDAALYERGNDEPAV